MHLVGVRILSDSRLTPSIPLSIRKLLENGEGEDE
jgi:hypothetical protein